MTGRREYRAEWINGKETERLARKRIAAANAKATQVGGDVIDPEKESFLDWVEPEAECYESRRFPSLAMAKGWAKRNAALDLWQQPRVYVTECTGPYSWDVETVETWSLESGEWELMPD